MKWSDFYERYDKAIAASGFSEAELLRRAGYGPDKIRNSRRREVAPTDLVSIIHIARAAGCSPYDLLEPLGVTPDLLGVPAPLEGSGEIVQDPVERALLRMWRAMNEDERSALAAVAERLADKVRRDNVA